MDALLERIYTYIYFYHTCLDEESNSNYIGSLNQRNLKCFVVSSHRAILEVSRFLESDMTGYTIACSPIKPIPTDYDV